MRHFKLPQNNIARFGLVSILIYYQTTTESVSKKIVEGTDVFVVLSTGYYKNKRPIAT